MTRAEIYGIELEATGFSEQGPRVENQDAYTLEAFAKAGLLALADGMGGEKSGRVAADAALQAVLANAPLRSLEDARRAVREADRTVSAMSEAEPVAHGGMGCALALLALTDGADGPGWIAAHVGDVRILSRSPDGLLRLETRDHTPAFARWEAGEISLDEIPDSAGANRLQRAVGRGGEADVSWLPARPGWSWLIISDGIYKAMRLDELSTAMSLPTSAETCEAIRRKVTERGADDNFTAVHVRVLGGPTTTIPDVRVMQTTASAGAGRSRGARSSMALLVGTAALVLAGLAFWSASTTSGEAARKAELDALRLEIDSLRVIVEGLRDPFGPAAPDSTPGFSAPPSVNR